MKLWSGLPQQHALRNTKRHHAGQILPFFLIRVIVLGDSPLQSVEVLLQLGVRVREGVREIVHLVLAPVKSEHEAQQILAPVSRRLVIKTVPRGQPRPTQVRLAPRPCRTDMGEREREKGD